MRNNLCLVLPHFTISDLVGICASFSFHVIRGGGVGLLEEGAQFYLEWAFYKGNTRGIKQTQQIEE